MTWLEGELAKRYEIKTQRTGRAEECEAEVKVLNRVIRKTKKVYEMEADP